MIARFALVVLAALVITTAAASRPLADEKELAADTSGDSGTAPDLTTAAVSNDNEGKLTWRIGVGNRSAFAAPDFVSIYIDADGADTGEEGFEFLIQHDPSQGAALFKWSGSQWEDAQSRTVAAAFANGVLEISIDFRELGSESLVFWFYSDTVPVASDDLWDAAPNGDDVHFFFVRVPLLFQSFTRPARITAGRTATLSLDVWTDSDSRGVVTCTGRYGAKRIRGTGSWASVTVTVPSSDGGVAPLAYKGKATCRFAIPRAAKRKALSLRVAATKGGATVFRTHTARAR